MAKRKVGLDITAGHLQINDSETVARSIADSIPSKVMNDGSIVPLSVDVLYATSLGSQPDRLFCVMEFKTPMVVTDRDVLSWLSEADVERPNVELHEEPDKITAQLESAEGLQEKRSIVQD